MLDVVCMRNTEHSIFLNRCVLRQLYKKLEQPSLLYFNHIAASEKYI